MARKYCEDGPDNTDYFDAYAEWDNIVDIVYEWFSDSGMLSHFVNIGAYNGVDH